jgi:hypothetical protein
MYLKLHLTLDDLRVPYDDCLPKWIKKRRKGPIKRPFESDEECLRMRKGQRAHKIITTKGGGPTRGPRRPGLTLLVPFNKLKTELEMVSRYTRSKKRTLAGLSALYCALWLTEWLFGLPVEFTLVGAGLVCLLIDLCCRAPAIYMAVSPVRLLKKELVLKKKLTRARKESAALLYFFFSLARRFLSNPSFRIAKAESLGLAHYC